MNGGPLEEGKPLMANHASQDLEDEEAEDLDADDEETEEPGNGSEKREPKVHTSSLSDDIIRDEMDFSDPNDLNLSCKTSPRRYKSHDGIPNFVYDHENKLDRIYWKFPSFF